MKEVYIVSAMRTPLGSFGGVLKSFSATELGSIAIKGALEKANMPLDQVDEVFIGNVVSANLGQAPAKQAAKAAGLAENIPCTTINKVCASGMKAIMFGSMSIMSGIQDVVVVGGMESMTNIPHYSPGLRWGVKYGDAKILDGLVRDGLQDPYDQLAMGVFADRTAEKFNFSREAQDAFAIESYKRSAQATENGLFKDEIIPVSVPQRRGDPIIVTQDEEFSRVKFDKIPQLRPAFSKDGTVTAANASTINDGASALVLASKEKVEELGLKPIAKVVSFADASDHPEWFTTAPSLAAPKALQNAGMSMSDIDLCEVNEAFAVVAMHFIDKMNYDHSKTNIMGGACSLGHPLGATGARIVTTLVNSLHQKDQSTGLATLCNGGGGASALIIERV